MKKSLYISLSIILLLCFVFASCSGNGLSKEETQSVRDALAGKWQISSEYLAQSTNTASLPEDYTIEIMANGHWLAYSNSTQYISDFAEYYVGNESSPNYSVVFEMSTTGESLTCIYSPETDSLFQEHETTSAVEIIDVFERLP